MRIKPTKYAMLLPLIAIMVCLYSYGHYTGSFETRTVPIVTVTPTQPNIYDLWRLTNAERAKNGLEPLVLNEKLNEVSQARCDDMVKQNYYDHANPQGLTPQNFITNSGIQWKYSGENIAAGHYTTRSVHQAWMDSPDHKANILDAVYTNIGLAVCHSDNHTVFGDGTIIVEDFIR